MRTNIYFYHALESRFKKASLVTLHSIIFCDLLWRKQKIKKWMY